MSEKRERAETLTTVQRDHVHETLAVQEGRDNHVAAAGQGKGGGAANAQDMRGHDNFMNNVPVGGQRRHERQFSAGSFMTKKTGSVLLKTGFVLMCLMMMMTNPMIMRPSRTPW